MDMSKRDKGQAASSYSLKVYCGYLPAHLRPEPRGEFWGFETCYSFVWFTKVYRPGKIWGRGHLLRKNFSLSLQARCIIVVWKKRWWVVSRSWMAEIWGSTQSALNISKKSWPEICHNVISLKLPISVDWDETLPWNFVHL